MYSFLHEILSDKKGGMIFSCFGVWHLIYIFITLATAIITLYFLKNKSEDIRKRVAKFFIYSAFSLYIADFFLMPLAYGEIDIEKLPFHACTAMCVMCFLSYHINFIKKYRVSFALLGFISNLVYLIYPAGLMWYQVSPLSYRVMQTLIFHSLMCIYGSLILVYENKDMKLKKCYRDFFVLVAMTLWAMLGNYTYNGTSDGYSHFFNWFFVVRDPFNIFPESFALFIMPILNIGIFFAVEILVYLIKILYFKIKTIH